MRPNLDIWLNHFEYHAQHPRHLPGSITNHLSGPERRLIASSIATFQLGEQSDGINLLRSAYRYAQLHSSPAVARITELFIREEQHHAALLRTFMAEHGLPAKTHAWTDTVFRRLRRLAGLELAVAVLLAAELIGIVFYRALEQATQCQKLRLLCRILVADELAHVGFESDLLQFIRADRSALGRLGVDLAHRALFGAAACVVWMTHRAVLRRGGHRFTTFLGACRMQYRFYLQPRRIEAPATPG